MAWYYNSRTGSVAQEDEKLMYPWLKLGIGWHGPFQTKQAALDYYDKGKAANPGWKKPTESLAGDLLDPLIPDKAPSLPSLSDADIRSWLIRIGEILLGVVLVGVGVAKLTGSSNPVAKLVKVKL